MYSVEDLKTIVEDALFSGIHEPESYSSYLEEAQKYSISAGGKRLRPCILLSVCEMLGGNVADALPYACALEYIHTYSLIHDDLPAMDNDDFRRGKPSNHKAFGEDIAILAGDGLLTRAAELMSEDMIGSISAGKVYAFNAILSCAYDMVKGQIADIKAVDVPDDEYFNFVHRNKTAALFLAAFQAGAYLAEADDEVLTDMSKAGIIFGMAFQLYDDYLDIDTDKTLSYAQYLGKDKSKEMIAEYLARLSEIIAKYENNEALRALTLPEI